MVSRVARFGLRIARQAMAKGILRCRGIDFHCTSTILLTGTARSGTTWLGTILGGRDEYCMVDEPLHPRFRSARKAPFSPGAFVELEEEWREGKKFFSELLSGQFLPAHALAKQNSLSDLLRCRAFAIKSVRLNRLLPWLSHRFQLRGMLLLIRHPCAVVASQLANSGFRPHPERVREPDRAYVQANLPRLIPQIDRLNTVEEYRAVTWCVDQHVPLRHSLQKKWLQVSYENLVIEGEEELKRIFALLSLELTARQLGLLRENSPQALEWSPDHRVASAEQRLSGWRRRLSDQQVNRIMSVVQRFGIRGYTDGVRPEPGGVVLDA